LGGLPLVNDHDPEVVKTGLIRDKRKQSGNGYRRNVSINSGIRFITPEEFG